MPQQFRIFRNFLLASLLILPSFVMAQDREITGTVISSESNSPLPGVTVTAKGTSVATVTNSNGTYRIKVPAKSSALVFSSASFLQQEVPIGTTRVIDVKMETDARAMSDVVVIGYQTVRRKDLLASVSSVSAKELRDVPVNSAAEALNGRLAGVTATTAEGSPDADIRIRVRGGMSITGDNSPLYIIDGVQVENGLNSISPQQIQSIDVLKDAAATAIYGARGGNGVVVITTKNGRQGRLTVSYNGFIGMKVLANKLEVMDPYDFVIYQSERSRGSATDSASFTKNFGTTWDTLSNYKNVPAVDWQEETFGRTGIMTTHNLNVTGGTKKFTYLMGYTYNYDKAIVINSDYQRHLFNAKFDYSITKNLKVGVSGRYNHQEVLGAGVSDTKGSSYNRLRNAVKYRPFLSENQELEDPDPLADPNVGNGLNLYNPIQMADAEYRQKVTNAYNVTAYLTYNITKNLSFKSTFGYDYSRYVDRQFHDTITPYSITQGGKKPIVALDTTTRQVFTNSNVLTYSLKGIRGIHDFDFLVGEETYDLRTEVESNLFRDYPSGTKPEDAMSQTNLGVPFAGYPKHTETRYTNLSFFGRINYSLLDRYLFSFNMRADGASKFAPGKQWGYFPAASFAWRIKNEKFMQDVKAISDLKFRVGYGKVGNNRIADYLYLTTFANDGRYYYGLNNQNVLAYYSTGLVNPDLQWEATVNRNFGLDVGVANGRVNFSIDYYHNTSSDLLLNVPIPSTYGYSSQLQNIGETFNKGIEIQVNAAIIKNTDGFNWNANFNISFNHNGIEALGVNQTQFFPAASWGVSGQPTDYIERIGHPVGAMWGLVTKGFYTVDDFNYNAATSEYTLKQGVVNNSGIIGAVMPGSIKFADLNNDGIVDLNNDRQIIGDPNPDFFGGLNQQFSYKQWDLSLFVNFSVGQDVYNANKIEFTNGYSNNSNMLSFMKDRWKVVTEDGRTALWVNSSNKVVGINPTELKALNADAKIWQPLKGSGAFYPHSWAIEDASFLRINNLTLGYNLPIKGFNSLHMSKLRFYFTANNLAVFTNYSGYDPEVNVRNNPLTPNLDYSAYPKSRSFIFGVNATF